MSDNSAMRYYTRKRVISKKRCSAVQSITFVEGNDFVSNVAIALNIKRDKKFSRIQNMRQLSLKALCLSKKYKNSRDQCNNIFIALCKLKSLPSFRLNDFLNYSIIYLVCKSHKK